MLNQKIIIALDSLSFEQKDYVFRQMQKYYDIADVDDFISDSIRPAYILSEEDKQNIVDKYRENYDWNYSGSDTLLNTIQNYLNAPLKDGDRVTVNVNFYNPELKDAPSQGFDQTQFDVTTLGELGECWLEFCDENGLDYINIGSYEVLHD